MWFIKQYERLCDWIAGFFNAESATSSKRAILILISILYYQLNKDFSRKVTEERWLFYQLILNVVLICLITGIATIQDVMKFFKKFKKTE